MCLTTSGELGSGQQSDELLLSSAAQACAFSRDTGVRSGWTYNRVETWLAIQRSLRWMHKRVESWLDIQDGGDLE
jgi:hypothetical protein